MRLTQLSIQLLFAAAAPLAAGHALAAGASPDLSDPAIIAAGAKRFNQNCVYCHGNAGSGGKAASLQNRDDLTKTRGAFLMPSWKASFNEQQIWELASYILSLKNVSPQK